MYLNFGRVCALEIQQTFYKNSSKRVSSATVLGILLLIYYCTSRFLSEIYFYLCYFVMTGKITLQYSVLREYFTENKDVVNSTVFQMTADISITLTAITVTLLVARLAFKTTVWSYLKPDKQRTKVGFKWLGPCFVFNMLASTVISFFTSFLNSVGVSVPTADFSIKQPSTFAVFMQFAYVAVLAPLFEEIVYRGLIIKLLSARSKSAAVLVSALAFGLMHGNIPQAASAFATGLIYAVIALRCGSIVPTVLIHSFNNLIVNSPELLGALGFKNYHTAISIIEICVALFGFFVWFTDYKFIFRYDDTPQTEEKKAAFKKVLTNPVLLIYFCVLVFVIFYRIFQANS